jgi:phage terminase small subunit
MSRQAIQSLVQVPSEVQLEEQRPPAPERLDKEETAEWRAIVERMPAGWFSRENLPVLEALVCQISALRIFEAQVRKFKSLDLSVKENRAELYKATQAQTRSSREVAYMSTKLRLTQQSNYDMMAAARAKRLKGGNDPWQPKRK